MGDRRGEVRRDHGCGRDLLGAGDRGGDQHGTGTGGRGGADVGPDVPDDDRLVGADPEGTGRLQHQARRRLAAGTAVGGPVRADRDDVEAPDLPLELVVDRPDVGARQQATGDARLIGDQADEQARRPQPLEAPRAPSTGRTSAGSPL